MSNEIQHALNVIDKISELIDAISELDINSVNQRDLHNLREMQNRYRARANRLETERFAQWRKGAR